MKDISATRLSSGDPIGFPPHPRGWFSIIVYQYVWCRHQALHTVYLVSSIAVRADAQWTNIYPNGG